MIWLFMVAYLAVGYGAGRLCAGMLADNTRDEELSLGRSLLRTLMFPYSCQNWQYRFSGDEYRGLRKCFPSNGSGVIQNQDSLISYRAGVLLLWPYLIVPMIFGGIILGTLFAIFSMQYGLNVLKKMIATGDVVFTNLGSLLITAGAKNASSDNLQSEYDLADLLSDVDKKIQAQLVFIKEERSKIEARTRDVQQLISDCTQLCADAQNSFIRLHNERLIQCSREELEGLLAGMKKIEARIGALTQQSSELKEWMRCVDLDERACTLLSSHIADVERSAFESAVGALEAVDLEGEFSERIALVQSHLEIKIENPESV